MCTATAGTARKSVRLKLLATTFASQTTRLSELRRHSSDAMGRLLGKRPTKKFKAQGTGPTKRTPKGEFDGAAGKDVYLVENILAERQARGAPEFLIRWQDYGAQDDTWEPLENLAGMEEHIARFRARQIVINEEALKTAEDARRARKQPRASTATGGGSSDGRTDDVPSREGGQDEAQVRKKRSKVWQHFKEISEEGKVVAVQCVVEGCSCPPLQWCGTTSNLRNRLASLHKEVFMEMTREGT